MYITFISHTIYIHIHIIYIYIHACVYIYIYIYPLRALTRQTLESKLPTLHHIRSTGYQSSKGPHKGPGMVTRSLFSQLISIALHQAPHAPLELRHEKSNTECNAFPEAIAEEAWPRVQSAANHTWGLHREAAPEATSAAAAISCAIASPLHPSVHWSRSGYWTECCWFMLKHLVYATGLQEKYATLL